MQSLSVRDIFIRNRRKVIVWVLLFWIVFAVLILVEDEVSRRMSNLTPDPIDRLQYTIRFALWTILTPLIIFIAIKFPIAKKNTAIRILTHFFIALLIVALEFCLEIPIIRMATKEIQGHAPPVIDYAAVFILKLNIYLLLYFLVVGVTWLVINIEDNSQAALFAHEAEIKNSVLQKELSEAQLRLLKMQLDPHFLFNTHHSIVSLMMNDQNAEAISMLTKLSDLLRLSLDEDKLIIPLEKELKVLRLYLEIQQIRFQDKLFVSYNIDPSAVDKMVPAFILQPLVENAILHGVSNLSLGGEVSIKIMIQNNMVLFYVENNGAKIDFDNYKEGIGISNTKERLRRSYNDRFEFELKNLPNGYVRAMVKIPAIEF